MISRVVEHLHVVLSREMTHRVAGPRVDDGARGFIFHARRIPHASGPLHPRRFGGHPRRAKERITVRGRSVNLNLSRPAAPWRYLTVSSGGYQHLFVISACRTGLTFAVLNYRDR